MRKFIQPQNHDEEIQRVISKLSDSDKQIFSEISNLFDFDLSDYLDKLKSLISQGDKNQINTFIHEFKTRNKLDEINKKVLQHKQTLSPYAKQIFEQLKFDSSVKLNKLFNLDSNINEK